MMPCLLLLGIGQNRRFWIPLSLLLLWPLWLLGWIVWLPLWLLRVPVQRAVRTGLLIPLHLSGLRVDVDSASGDHVHIRFI